MGPLAELFAWDFNKDMSNELLVVVFALVADLKATVKRLFWGEAVVGEGILACGGLYL